MYHLELFNSQNVLETLVPGTEVMGRGLHFAKEAVGSSIPVLLGSGTQ